MSDVHQHMHPMNKAILEALHLDPHQVSVNGFLITADIDGVRIQWEGMARMDLDEFQVILDKAGINKVVRE